MNRRSFMAQAAGVALTAHEALLPARACRPWIGLQER